MELESKIKDRAKQLGFDRVGIAPAEEAVHADQYLDWLSEGRHGTMDYLDKYHEQRRDPSVMNEGAKTGVVLLKNYYREDDKLEGGLRIARYAQGDDYHDVLWERMRELASFIHAETGADVATRPATDTAPVLERDLATAAGLGWIGKNAMLINPEIGSYVFIAEILVAAELETDNKEVPDRCGTCSRCIDACPTNAISSPYVIEARRCISYLTIELRGPIPRHLRSQIGDHVFGCDICQDVCPWNTNAEPTEDPAFKTREKYRKIGPEQLLQFDIKDYQNYFSKSAMKRAKPVGLRRNAAVVLGNTASDEMLPTLVEQFHRDQESLVRGHIAWAIGRIGGERAEDTLCHLKDEENNSYVLDELRYARRLLTND